MSIVPLDWSMDDTNKQRLMHEHVRKCAKRMLRSKESQTGGTKQEWQATLHKAGRHQGMHLTSGYASIGHEGDGCNHIRTSPWGARSMAKPRSREASIDIKHRSKQTYTCI